MKAEKFLTEASTSFHMHLIQKKLMQYHHGYFMGAGLALFLVGFTAQFLSNSQVTVLQALTVLGALLLGWGTGRCDQKACT
ncbi:MAG: hypothetical protein ABEK04_01195 [Candidatus Nanohalobium sp.]